MDTFGEMMNKLFKVKDMFPSMTQSPTYNNYGGSFLTITIPITDENAQLLIDAQKMFEPVDEYRY